MSPIVEGRDASRDLLKLHEQNVFRLLVTALLPKKRANKERRPHPAGPAVFVNQSLGREERRYRNIRDPATGWRSSS